VNGKTAHKHHIRRRLDNELQNYPDCQVEFSDYIGDGWCDDAPYNAAECGWDGGDCCEDT